MRKLDDFFRSAYDLDLQESTINSVDGVSADGLRIVGSGMNPSGRPEAWIAILGYDGDFDDDGTLASNDIDLLLDAVNNGGSRAVFDLNFDSLIFLVRIFRAGEYEHATWETGDWNGDGEFTTSDLVFAFQDGGYEQDRDGSRAVSELTFHR